MHCRRHDHGRAPSAASDFQRERTAIVKNSMRALAAAAILGVGTAGSAGAVPVTVQTANQGGVAFSAELGSPGFNTGGAITASFNYNGPLNFVNTAPQNGNSSGDLNSSFFTTPG